MFIFTMLASARMMPVAYTTPKTASQTRAWGRNLPARTGCPVAIPVPPAHRRSRRKTQKPSTRSERAADSRPESDAVGLSSSGRPTGWVMRDGTDKLSPPRSHVNDVPYLDRDREHAHREHPGHSPPQGRPVSPPPPEDIEQGGRNEKQPRVSQEIGGASQSAYVRQELRTLAVRPEIVDYEGCQARENRRENRFGNDRGAIHNRRVMRGPHQHKNRSYGQAPPSAFLPCVPDQPDSRRNPTAEIT